MADGDRIIIGQANTASNPGNETSLSRNAATASTVFTVRNLNVDLSPSQSTIHQTPKTNTLCTPASNPRR
jgi:hypothetical protein